MLIVIVTLERKGRGKGEEVSIADDGGEGLLIYLLIYSIAAVFDRHAYGLVLFFHQLPSCLKAVEIFAKTLGIFTISWIVV